MDFVGSWLRLAMPLVLAALGGTLSERAGVVNLALEGLLTAGALGATLVSAEMGVVGGVVGGIVGGIAIAAVFALVVLRFRADQVVAGVAINLLVAGLARYVLVLRWHQAASSPRVPGIDGAAGAIVFGLGVLALVVLLHTLYKRTVIGLRWSAIGDRPDAAATLGVDVIRLRWLAVLGAGALAGLGGAWLALDNKGFYSGMTQGGGYIAIAAVIMGRWRPVGAVLACLFFALVEAWSVSGQSSGFLPRELVQTMPYLVTLCTMAGLLGRARAPAALGRPWWGT
jgi:simple sugar transport system permease protein